MRFQFDPAKARSNFEKHGVSLADGEGVFDDIHTIHRPDPDAEGEMRFIAVGLGSGGVILVVVYTMRGEDIRLISTRRANRREVKDYES
ncbi:MAG TPA: BrnT family toxin [Thermoanaerobaculia bacterium]|jgi:uncharacterized DUF497 family protein|nr:BrnT family toxin [Thermoanaerobaculia bacterium]